MSTTLKGASLAAAAAFLAMSALANATTPPEGSAGMAVAADDMVHCYGVNTCKGTADCKTTMNECKGQNGCKGLGFKASKASECLSMGGVIGDLKP